MEGGINRRSLVKGAAIGTAAAALPAAAAQAAARAGETRVDVAVVGAGLAGLYAAQQLKRGGRSVVILEANDRVGGRILNLSVGDRFSDVTEGGGEWINPAMPHVKKLLKRFNLKLYQNYDQGRSTLIVDGNVSRYTGAVPDIPHQAKKEFLRGFLRLERMAKSIPVDAPWTARRALEWDSQTAQTWIEDNMTVPLALSFAEQAIGGAGAWSTRDMSLLHYLFVAAANGGPLNLVTLNQGALANRVVGGSGQLVIGLAKPLDKVTELNTPVTTIEHGGSRVRLTTPNGRWVADHVIVAVSPTMTQQILFDPDLPVYRNQSVQRTGNGSAIKAYPIYRTPFWRDKGLNGIIQSNQYLPFISFDNSPPGNSVGVPLALIESANARRLGAMSRKERKAEIIDGFALAFGPKAREPIGYVEHDWSSEPWIRGGAASFFPPGLMTEYQYLFAKRIGRIHFASTETETSYWGTMEGALASGDRAAQEVLAR
jgi:monoamine oxidase